MKEVMVYRWDTQRWVHAIKTDVGYQYKFTNVPMCSELVSAEIPVWPLKFILLLFGKVF